MKQFSLQYLLREKSEAEQMRGKWPSLQHSGCERPSFFGAKR